MADGVRNNEGFLKLIIVQKFSAAVIEVLLAVWVLRYLDTDMGTATLQLAGYFNLDIENSIVQFLLEEAGMIGNGTIIGISIVLFLSGIISLVEGYGLHKRSRWGEWFTVFSTGSFIPLEVYAIAVKVSFIKVLALVFNCAVVYYLARHKELFNSKGRKSVHTQSL